MAASDLTTLANVKAWLSVTDGKSDAILSRLISSVSAQILAYIGRDAMYSHPRSEVRDGSGTNVFLLANWPVTQVVSVTIDGASIPPSLPVTGGDSTAGWILSPWDEFPPGSNQLVSLKGGLRFNQGTKNINIVYIAGYAIYGEATVVSSSPYNVIGPYGSWSYDNGVTFTDTGASLTPITSGTPTTGQYLIETSSLVYPDPGTYLFSAADVGRPVAINYSYIPTGLEQIVIEEVCERYKYRDRIGLQSKSLGGQETVTYDLSGFPKYVVLSLNNWRSVVTISP